MLRAWRPSSPGSIGARDFNWKYLTTQFLKLIVLLIALSIWINNDSRHWNDDPTGLMPNVTVARDGTGSYSTVSEALATAPNSSQYQYRIHIKAGVYWENVIVGRYKTNIIFVGEGIGRTIIVSSQNHGLETDGTAALVVKGSGFVSIGMTFKSSSVPRVGSGVAVRNYAHQSAFFRCSFVGYKNTLHAAHGHQFYRECDVYGTVDFIFGDAAAVFQRCGLYARKPLPGQKIVVTAQDRRQATSHSGFAIHECRVGTQEAFLSWSVETYLGRPAKAFSRVVVMKSYLGFFIHPKGWLASPGGAEDTVYYREYDNNGPGSFTRRRVKWPGFQVTYNSSEAAEFTVAAFIEGNTWLPSTGLPFKARLR